MRLRCTWLLLLLAGCSFETEPALETLDNRCGSDAECAEGICDGSICIASAAASLDIAIEVVGSAAEPPGMIPASWAFVAEPVDGPSMRDLVLPAVREVRGTVRWAGAPVPATLRFIRRMPNAVAPLRPVPVEVDTLRETAFPSGADEYDFTTSLVAGEAYDVIVVPTSDMVMSPSNDSAPAIRSLPPLYLEAVVDDGDLATPFRFDVVFPAQLDEPCGPSETKCCSLTASVISFDGESVAPEPGLQIRAVDPEDGRVVSSIAETDAIGQFVIRLGEDADDYLIRVTSSPGRDPFPAVNVDPEVAFEGDPLTKVIYIPRLDSVQFSGRVRDEEGTPVPEATVVFASSGIFGGAELGLEGSFNGSTKSDEEGRFTTQLLPGFYQVTVTPPEDTDNTWGVLSSEALVGEEMTVAEALVVPTRVELFGWVRTFSEEAAVGVTVVARARTSPDSTPHRSQEDVSNSLGRFTMLMDTGLYDMQLKVPPESGYPWVVEPALNVESDLGRTYLLPPPVPVEGAVLSSEGIPVPGAVIRAYVLANDRQLQVAESTSDEDGDYRLLIAPRLVGE